MDVKEKIDENNNLRIDVKSDSHKATYSVVKTNDGFAMFEVVVSKGRIPKALSGRYTTAHLALDKVKKYITDSGASRAVERDNKYKALHPDKV